jgi:hypothetical protein
MSEAFDQSTNLKVTWDVDDVLLPSGALTIEYYNAAHGTSLTPDDWYSLEDLKKWGVGPDEGMLARSRVSDILSSVAFMNTITATPGSEAVVEFIDTVGSQAAVTGRPDFLQSATIRTLSKLYGGHFHDNNVYFTDHLKQTSRAMTKLEVVRDLNATDHVDDHLDHVLPIGRAGVAVALYGRYKYNEIRDEDLPATVTRVYDMDALLEYFQNRNNLISSGELLLSSKRVL